MTSKKAIPEPNLLKEPKFQLVLYIYYLIQLSKKRIQAFINSRSEMNVINPNFAKKLGLRIYQNEIGTQKIDGSSLEIFGIVTAFF